MFIAHTQGDKPELLEEDAVLVLDCGKREPGVGFQMLDWANRELSETQTHQSGGRNTGGETSLAQGLTGRFPQENTQSVNQWGWEQLDHSPRLQNYQGTTVALSLKLSCM